MAEKLPLHKQFGKSLTNGGENAKRAFREMLKLIGSGGVPQVYDRRQKKDTST